MEGAYRAGAALEGMGEPSCRRRILLLHRRADLGHAAQVTIAEQAQEPIQHLAVTIHAGKPRLEIEAVIRDLGRIFRRGRK